MDGAQILRDYYLPFEITIYSTGGSALDLLIPSEVPIPMAAPPALLSVHRYDELLEMIVVEGVVSVCVLESDRTCSYGDRPYEEMAKVLAKRYPIECMYLGNSLFSNSRRKHCQASLASF
jgi:hypothetical protein